MCLLVQLVIAQAISGALKQLGLTRFEVSNASSWPGTILTWHLLWAEEVPSFTAGVKSRPQMAMLSGNAALDSSQPSRFNTNWWLRKAPSAADTTNSRFPSTSTELIC